MSSSLTFSKSDGFYRENILISTVPKNAVHEKCYSVSKEINLVRMLKHLSINLVKARKI